MANKITFTSRSRSTKRSPVPPVVDTINAAGGVAYQRPPKEALALFAATGTFNDTYYASAKEQLETVLALANAVDTDFLAKVTVWSRESAFMKDSPALLLAVLSKRSPPLFQKVFPRIITNGRMLRTFVQIMRSGVTGRKSLGSAPKREIQKLLTSWSSERLFNASVGNNPSLRDVIRMVHPKANSLEQNALFAYLTESKEISTEHLPDVVKQYEQWKASKEGTLPNVDFQLLTALALSPNNWKSIFRNANWHFTRMNLNTAQRHSVFEDTELVNLIARRLADPKEIRKAKAFPYQIFATYLNIDDVPVFIRDALHDAMEVAIENVPSLEGQVFVAVDCSASMDSPITGNRKGSSSKVTCNNVAALIASAIVRRNKTAKVVRFDTKAHYLNVDHRDTVITNASKIGYNGGGTNVGCPLSLLNSNNEKGDLIVLVSDHESWSNPHSHYLTNLESEWQTFKRRNPSARMVLVDLEASDTTTQAPTRQDVLNVGGFSDNVFSAIASFTRNGLDASFYINQIERINM